jgi:hypothetical protein
MKRRLVAVLVAIVVIIAGVLAGVLISRSGGGNGGNVIADGPTFYQALAGANSSILTVSGGPWTLFEALGVASPVPSYPSAWGWGEYDKVLANCAPAFNGLTIWNGSLPLFNGTFNSGTAPFWEFFYFSNASQQITTVTDVLGTLRAYDPISMTSVCAEQSTLGLQPWRSAWGFDRGAFPGNTPGMASGAWNSVAKKFVTWLGVAPTEMYLVGDLQFGSGQPITTQTSFFLCGTEGAAGVTPGLDVFANTNDTSEVSGSFNYSLGCTPTTNQFTPIPLDVTFFNNTEQTSASAEFVTEQFRFEWNGSPPYTGPGYNSRGVTSGVVALNLTDRAGEPLPGAPSECGEWVSSISQCNANSSGWYAVLLGPDGEWEGSYGQTAVGLNWTDPVLPIANNESLVIVVPSSWNLSGDTLDITSTADQLLLNGSVVLG